VVVTQNPDYRAVIEIGMNATKLVIGWVDDDGRFRLAPLMHNASGQVHAPTDRQFIPIGEDIAKKKRIETTSFDLLITTLKDWRERMKLWNVSELAVVASAQFIKAANEEDVRNRIFIETGWLVYRLDQKEEAQLAFYSSAQELDLEGRTLVVDIGGGSMQLTLGERTTPIDRLEYAFTKFGSNELRKPENINRLEEMLMDKNAAFTEGLEELETASGFFWHAQHLVITGGAARRLARLIKQFPADQGVSGYRLEKDDVVMFARKLRKMPSHKLHSFDPEEMAAVGLLLGVLAQKCPNADGIIPSGCGVREGVFLAGKRGLQRLRFFVPKVFSAALDKPAEQTDGIVLNFPDLPDLPDFTEPALGQ
jgi:exopolyphosphatase/pppGpp-phosphohydrolase